MKNEAPNDTKFRIQSDQLETLTEDAHEMSNEEFRELANRIDLYKDIPTATDVSGSFNTLARPFVAEVKYNGEYRGWYGNRWCPKQSKFGGPRAGGKSHLGSDIYVPKGTPLWAIVGPARIQWNPKGTGGKWGNHIFLNFAWNDGNNYTFVYSHLDSLLGSAPRNVALEEDICTSGCSGNAGGPGMYCGVDNRCGGRSDHLHLELFGPNGGIDPIGWLGWNLRYHNDATCAECSPKN